MKRTIQLTRMGALLGAGAAQAATTYTTSAVQTITVALTATVQARINTDNAYVTTASVTTKDLIAAIGKALNTNFSATAKLLLITPGTSPAEGYFVVRDVVNKVTVDTQVDRYISKSVAGDVRRYLTVFGKYIGAMYMVVDLTIQNNPTLFAKLAAYGTFSYTTGAVTYTGFGTGAVGQKEAVFRGSVTFSAERFEKVAVPGQSAAAAADDRIPRTPVAEKFLRCFR